MPRTSVKKSTLVAAALPAASARRPAMSSANGSITSMATPVPTTGSCINVSQIASAFACSPLWPMT
jgi:hypothetical protein